MPAYPIIEVGEMVSCRPDMFPASMAGRVFVVAWVAPGLDRCDLVDLLDEDDTHEPFHPDEVRALFWHEEPPPDSGAAGWGVYRLGDAGEVG